MPEADWMIEPRARIRGRVLRPRSSLPRWREVFRIRRQLPLLGGHQISVPAHQIVFLADGDIGGSFQARLPAPVRIFLGAVPVGLVDGPRARQRFVEYGDHVVENARIALVEENPFLEGRFVVEVQRCTGTIPTRRRAA